MIHYVLLEILIHTERQHPEWTSMKSCNTTSAEGCCVFDLPELHTNTCTGLFVTMIATTALDPFSFQNCPILHRINSKRCWKHSSETWVLIDMINSTSPIPPQPKDARMDWDLVAVEEIWVQWIHYHVKEISLNALSFATWCVILLEATIRRRTHCGHKSAAILR